MSKSILDSSAILALVKKEVGADKVEPLLGESVMSSVNVAETAATLMQDSGMSLNEVQDCILPLISMIVAFDEEQAFHTAQLREKTKSKGLSIGDRACIALGIKMKFPVYTADKIWAELSIDGLDLKLIR